MGRLQHLASWQWQQVQQTVLREGLMGESNWEPLSVV